MVVALQISDLHRSSADPVGNAELLAALESDRVRWPAQVAHGPDVIVVSGDVVQGVGLEVSDYEAKLDRQYNDAAEFLADLADRFLGSDRSRLILVPGNHDIDWCTARAAMEVVEGEDLERIAHELPSKVLDPASPYRWSWRDRKLYKVVDSAMYKARCLRFLDFRRDFYDGVFPDPLRLGPDLVFVEYPNLDVSITGFSSWFGNDCYCPVGAFDPEMLAAARDAIAGSSCGLHLAVWHHNTAGPPAETDFLDIRHVHRLIDYGFRVGLHGHHHRTDAAVMTLKLPMQEEFALVSAGSLAAGHRELPPGVNRQYSLLDIRPASRQLRVHVREAIGDLIFAASARTELGGHDYVDLQWSPPPPSPARSAAITAVIDDAYRAFADDDLPRSLELLRTVPAQGGPARKLRIEVLSGLEDWEEVTETIGDPISQEELMILVDALCRLDSQEKAREAIQSYAEAVHLGPDLKLELEARISITETST